MLNNYRVCFGGEKIDYKSNFSEVRKYYPVIQQIVAGLKGCGITDVWWFFEPYVEITWIDNKNQWINIKAYLEDLLEGENYRFSTPENGQICDWYCDSDEEREFGAKTYARSAELADLFYRYDSSIMAGKGWENQYMRRMHVLANQLGFNYKEEAVLLLKRSVLCFLFWFLGHNKAVWIYTKILRNKY